MIPADDRSPFRNQRWTECEGSDLQFGDCVRITDSIRVVEEGIRTVFQVATPDETSQPNTVIIGHMHGSNGYCTNDFPTYAKCNQSVAVGDRVGPIAGARSLGPGATGYIVMGDIQGGMARVRRMDSSSNCNFVDFKILETGTNALGIRWARVQITARPCGCDEVPEETDGILTGTTGPTGALIPQIYDLKGCFLNEPDIDLVGRLGSAYYVQDLRFIQSPIEPGNDVPDCTWSIHSLCCPTCDPPETETSSPSSGDSPSAMITGDGPGPIPGQFLE